MHHAFLYKSFLCRPCTTTTWNDQILSFFEDGNGKAINSTISVWTRAWPSLFSSNINSLLLSNWATLYTHEMVWKDAESIFQRGFHGRRRCRIVRSLKQQLRRRLRKRHLKSEFALLQTLSRLFHLVYFVKCWRMFLKFNSKGLYQSSGKEKENCCFVFPSSTKREVRRFHVVVVQRRLRSVQKRVMHVQSCYFANLNLLVYCCSRYCRCLSFLI